MANSTHTKIIWPYYRETLAEQSAILSDQYALTMAQALFSDGKHDINTTFHAYIRKEPFNGSYLLTAGQNIIFEWMKNNWKFDAIDCEILRDEKVIDPHTGRMTRLYTDEFVDMLSNSKFELTVDAMPEGEIAFGDEPIMRINGPVWQCLMVEAAILNNINSQSLFATLGSRFISASQGDAVIELGLRRAQSIGGLEATRGAYIGGINGTSNMLAKKYYGIPSVGTMAHAYIMFHDNEEEAFDNWAQYMPHNGTFLTDTYNTVQGTKNAVAACRKAGVTLKGTRLDSGDLNALSKEARTIQNAGGFERSSVVASNDLDVSSIVDLKANGSEINIWGVGTNLVTSKEQPALGAVYKLGAVFDYYKTITQEELDILREGVLGGLRSPDALNGLVKEKIKLSGDAIKVTIPGELDVIRHLKATKDGFVFNGDTIVNHLQFSAVTKNALNRSITTVKKNDTSSPTHYATGSAAYRPLKSYFKQGVLVSEIETIHDARLRAAEALAMLGDNYRSLENPEKYDVRLEQSLYKKRQSQINTYRPAF
jgi:nicotinate phosphoribosyltransferase